MKNNKIFINKNKDEVFQCHLKTNGTSLKNTSVRLCLEFSNNKNIFFYGKLDETGNCTIHVPKLKDVEVNDGKMIIEAISDSIYFKLYEGEVEIKSSIEIDSIKRISKKEEEPVVEHVKNEKIKETKSPIIENIKNTLTTEHVKKEEPKEETFVKKITKPDNPFIPKANNDKKPKLFKNYFKNKI